MRPVQFIIQISIFSALVALLIYGLLQLPTFAPFHHFSWLSLVFFIILCLFIYFLAWLGDKRKDPMLNFRMGIMFNFLKIFGSAIFVYGYHVIHQPSSKLFVLPFFLIYALYTAFELYFLIKLFKTD